MRRAIFTIITFVMLLAVGTSNADAKRHHHRKYHRVAARVVTRPSRSHGVNLNGNVGVGVGPIHVGAGAGGGVQVHERTIPPDLLNQSDPPPSPTTAFLCPSLDTAQCNVPVPGTTTSAFVPSGAPQSIAAVEIPSNYFYYASVVYAPPKAVTVGGFSVPVTGDPLYFSLFKHRHGEAPPTHNHKGEDATAAFGASPRPGGLPESISSSVYSVAPKEQ
ncbi:MAG: hypothetical protein Q8922_07885 [Bacteroidota bacterium]|nr:hypothetical protein [Bacteroidota bacterium]MDP4233188.1 hypothetical protein [Bacteroidota bacterium]MDP4242193.1 hypothetical protein [Bacteroidota bacterium]MDP4287844.1 hypothetical protein [Bacteroidota bacterium]